MSVSEARTGCFESLCGCVHGQRIAIDETEDNSLPAIAMMKPPVDGEKAAAGIAKPTQPSQLPSADNTTRTTQSICIDYHSGFQQVTS